MHTIVVIFHVIVALFLILIVLLQTGKGAAMGSAFGGGASQAMFGSAGAGNVLTKLTTAAAIIFMITSLSLATISSGKKMESVIPEAEHMSAPSDDATSKAPTGAEEKKDADKKE